MLKTVIRARNLSTAREPARVRMLVGGTGAARMAAGAEAEAEGGAEAEAGGGEDPVLPTIPRARKAKDPSARPVSSAAAD